MEINDLNIYFDTIWKYLPPNKNLVKKNFVKKLIPKIFNKITNTIDSQKIIIEFYQIKDYYEKIINYIYSYHLFYTWNLDEQERAEKVRDEDYENMLIDSIADDIVSQDFFNIIPKSVTSKYSPEIIICDNFCNNILQMLKKCLTKESSEQNIKINMFSRSFLLVKSILMVLYTGISSDALILCRTLFELECTILILNKSKDEVLQEYLNIQRFYVLQYLNDEEINENEDYVKLNKELTEILKKNKCNKIEYINYGWSLLVDDYKKINCKLNFKNSLFKLAGCEESRYKDYITACKATHPTPFSIFENSDYMYIFIVQQLYGSMLNIFDDLKNLLNNEHYNISDGLKAQYKGLKVTYRGRLQQCFDLIYERYEKISNEDRSC